MNAIELAREIGRQIQKDDKYLAYQIAVQAADADEELQNLISEFNLKKIALSNETAKSPEEKDAEKVKKYNGEMIAAYNKVMANPKMVVYQKTQQELDNFIRRIQTIIQMSAQGGDPETVDYDESCTGDCSTCGGCH